MSPVGDQLTLDFAKALVAGEELGKDEIPDYLSISFSSVDAVNHFFGPSSLENEDIVLLQFDRRLAELLAFVDETVGLQHTLIVLSADHGIPEMPEEMAERGVDAERLYPEEIIARANAAAEEEFGVANAVRSFFRPYLYLDEEVITAAELDPGVVERKVAAALTQSRGIALAAARSELPALTESPLVEAIRRNHHDTRSGDVYVVQEPYWFVQEKGPIAAQHGSPWRYDTHVPIFFAGAGIEARSVARTVHPADVAPTLAARLGVRVPAAAAGTPLREVLR